MASPAPPTPLIMSLHSGRGQKEANFGQRKLRMRTISSCMRSFHALRELNLYNRKRLLLDSHSSHEYRVSHHKVVVAGALPKGESPAEMTGHRGPREESCMAFLQTAKRIFHLSKSCSHARLEMGANVHM